jgi:hypothetical protein
MMENRKMTIQSQIKKDLKFAMQHSDHLPDPKAEKALANIEEIKRDLQKIREMDRRG